MESSLLTFIPCGLTFDVAGVLFLGAAFFLKTKKGIIQEAGTYWDSNPYVLRSIISSRLDGMSGTTLLFVGFLFQIFGYFKLQSEIFIGTSYVLLGVFILVYLINFRKRIVNAWCSELEEIIKKQ